MQDVVRSLSVEEQNASTLATWATALSRLVDLLGDEASLVLARIAVRAAELGDSAVGLSAPPLLVVAAESADHVWRPAYGTLARAVGITADRMGPMQLEMSAYGLARLLRGTLEGIPDIEVAIEALLRHGCSKVDRFMPRGLMNFFVAMERLSGPVVVRQLAQSVSQKLQGYRAEDLVGCTAGERYRACLCLVRCGTEAAKALARLFPDAASAAALAPHARQLLLGRLRAANVALPPEACGHEALTGQ